MKSYEIMSFLKPASALRRNKINVFISLQILNWSEIKLNYEIDQV